MFPPENRLLSAPKISSGPRSDIHDSDSESVVSTSSPSSSFSTSASSIVPFVFPTTVPSYLSAHQELKDLLPVHDPSSEQVQIALRQLALSMPFHPPPRIIRGEPCVRRARVEAHLNSTFEEALDNIGTWISDREKMFLQYIIQHPCWGWSATPKQHRNASGFRYLQNLYPQLNNLQPILDDGVWPEEAQYFPPGLEPGPPSHILFASESGYYFHKMDEAILYKAGSTLEEVFQGLKYCKYFGPAGPEKDEWEGVDTCTDWFEPSQYFPNYKFDHDDPHWVLGWEIPEPPESMDQQVEYRDIPISRYC